MKKKLSLAGEASILSLSKIIIQVLLLFSIMILTRKWTKNEYGTYSQMQISVNLLMSIMMLGLPNSINYFIVNSKTKADRNNYLSTYYTTSTILGVSVGIISILLIPFLEKYFMNDTFNNYIVFLAIIPLTKMIMSSIESVLIVYKKAGTVAIFNMLHGALIILAALITLWMDLSFGEYLTVYLIIECSFTLIIYFLINRLDGVLRVRIDPRLLKKVLLFSVPLGLASVAGTLQIETDKLIIAYFYNTETLAIYANAGKELPIKIISIALSSALLPYLTKMFSEKKTKEAISIWKDTTSLSLVFHTFISIALIVFRKEAMVFLYSEKYTEGSTVFGIYSLIYIVRATSFGSLLAAMGNTKGVLKTELIMLIMNTALNIVLYYAIGFIGPAIATVFVSTSAMLIILGYACKQTHIRMRNIYPWKDLAILIVVNLALGILFNILKSIIRLDEYITAPGEAFLLAGAWAGIIFLFFRKKIAEKWHVMCSIS